MDDDMRFCSKCGDPSLTENVLEKVTLQDLIPKNDLSNNVTAKSSHIRGSQKYVKGYLIILFWVFFFPIMILVRIVKDRIKFNNRLRRKMAAKKKRLVRRF
jgi:hypothetical protein